MLLFSHSPTFSRPWRGAAILLVPFFHGCVGAGPATGVGTGPTPESVWEALNQPRPEPLEGAARVSVEELRLALDPWSLQGPVPAALGVQELASAGLLGRRDIEYVERRRFSAAAEKERRGEPRPRGAPPVGVSPGSEYILSASWVPVSANSGSLELRLLQAETGALAATARRVTPASPDPVALARSMVSGLLEALEGLGRLPPWPDPFPEGAPREYVATDYPVEAVTAFFRGVAAEDRYDWEGARRAYQEALDAAGPGFREARPVLSRVARLRAGGTLGAGDLP
jgi:hypothetical protein